MVHVNRHVEDVSWALGPQDRTWVGGEDEAEHPCGSEFRQEQRAKAWVHDGQGMCVSSASPGSRQQNRTKCTRIWWAEVPVRKLWKELREPSGYEADSTLSKARGEKGWVAAAQISCSVIQVWEGLSGSPRANGGHQRGPMSPRTRGPSVSAALGQWLGAAHKTLGSMARVMMDLTAQQLAPLVN